MPVAVAATIQHIERIPLDISRFLATVIWIGLFFGPANTQGLTRA